MKLSKRSGIYETWNQYFYPVPPADEKTHGSTMMCKQCGEKYYWNQFENITKCKCGNDTWEQLGPL